MGYRV